MQKEPLAESLHICKSFGEKWLALWKKKRKERWEDGGGGEREGEERLAESSAFMELPGTP